MLNQYFLLKMPLKFTSKKKEKLVPNKVPWPQASELSQGWKMPP